MFAAFVSFPTPVEAQPRSHTACERVSFATFFTYSVEGISRDGIAACFDGATRPSNQVFVSWEEAPVLLRHLHELDSRRLLPGVTRESIPSPGEVALANIGVLHARCEPVESEGSDAGVADVADAATEDDAPAADDADTSAPEVVTTADAGVRPHRIRAHLSRSAMHAHPWNPSAWFSDHECAGGRSIEIRPAEAVTVSRVVRNDAFVADATRRLADPARDLHDMRSLATNVRTRLASANADPIPAAMYPLLADACLATVASLPDACFAACLNTNTAATADRDVTEQLRLARLEIARSHRENDSLRDENRGLRGSIDTLKSLPTLLGFCLAGVLILFVLFFSWAWSSMEKMKKNSKRLTDEKGGAARQAHKDGEEQGRKSVFEFVARYGYAELIDSGLPILALASAVQAEGDRVRAHYENEVIPHLRTTVTPGASFMPPPPPPGGDAGLEPAVAFASASAESFSYSAPIDTGAGSFPFSDMTEVRPTPMTDAADANVVRGIAAMLCEVVGEDPANLEALPTNEQLAWAFWALANFLVQVEEAREWQVWYYQAFDGLARTILGTLPPTDPELITATTPEARYTLAAETLHAILVDRRGAQHPIQPPPEDGTRPLPKPDHESAKAMLAEIKRERRVARLEAELATNSGFLQGAWSALASAWETTARLEREIDNTRRKARRALNAAYRSNDRERAELEQARKERATALAMATRLEGELAAERLGRAADFQTILAMAREDERNNLEFAQNNFAEAYHSLVDAILNGEAPDLTFDPLRVEAGRPVELTLMALVNTTA